MADESRQVNFTIVPGDDAGTPRAYANFCAVAHTPFDVTLTFCEVTPLTESDIRNAQAEHVVRAPVRVSVVLPAQVLPNLIGALQEQLRSFQESYSNAGLPKGPVN
jgi:hypothetical protein